MFLAVRGSQQVGQGKLSLGERNRNLPIAGLLIDKRLEDRQGRPTLIDRSGKLAQRNVNGADAEVRPGHLVADFGIGGIARLKRLEALEGVVQQVAAHGLGLGNALEPLVGNPHQHLRDRRQGVARVFLGAGASRDKCKI